LKGRAIAATRTASSLGSRTLPQRSQDKENTHRSITNQYSPSSLREPISWHGYQGRTG
ncbi:hypothetical protein DBR06_SOUSAS1410082, partial [Sousa chinensis]